MDRQKLAPALAACVILALTLAGCSTKPHLSTPDHSTTTPSGGSESGSPPTSSPPGAGFIPRHLALTGCSGGGIIHQGPEALYPGHVPPGWESTDGSVDLYYRVYECKRVSLDRFERGPVRMLFELHTHGSFPLSCQKGNFDVMANMESWWMDDAELVAYGKATYGLPLHYMQFNRSLSPDTTGKGYENWTWQGSNGKESRLDFFGYDPTPQTEKYFERIFWFNATRLFLTDFDWHSDDVGIPLPSELQPPLIYSNATGVAEIVSLGAQIRNEDGQGDFHAFSDYQCQKPVY